MRRTLAIMMLLAATGCGDDEAVPTAAPLTGELELELFDSASLTIEPGEGGSSKVSLTATAGYGLLPAGEPLTGDGFVEPLPESSCTLYTAKLSAPPQAGRCQDEPVSLALSLHRQGANTTVIGGLSAYCGDEHFGVPVRVLRLSGPLPLP